MSSPALDDHTREVLTEAAARSDDALWAFRPNAGGQTAFIRHCLRAFESGSSSVTALLGGNRSGKSEAGAYIFAWLALIVLRAVKRTTGITPILWVVCKGFEECGEIAWKQKLSKFIRQRNIEVIAWRNATLGWPAMIRLKNGVEIHFKSWEQGRDAFQGSAIMGAWFDEQFPRDVFEEVQTRTGDYHAPLIITLSPIDPDPHLQSKHDDPPENWRFFFASIDENRRSRGGHLDDSEVDRLIASWPEEIRDTRRNGHFAAFAGAVYRSFKRSIHVIDDGDDPLFKRLPENCWRGVGIDFGFNNPTAVVWGARDSEGRWLIYDEHYEAEQGMEHHAGRIGALITAHGYPHPDGWRPEVLRSVYADPGDSMPITDSQWRMSARAYLAQRGLSCQTPVKDIHRGVEIVQTAMRMLPDGKPGLIISGSRCQNLIREIAGYRYPKATASKDARDIPLDKDNHAADALRYLIASYERAAMKMDLPQKGDKPTIPARNPVVPIIPK